MSHGTLAELATILGCDSGGGDAPWRGVSTDTRTLEAGQLFVALNGPNFRGADFVGAARQRGAAAAVVDTRVDDTLPQLVVGDTRKALGRLAADWRNRFDPVVIAVTGSNGKTTVKQMLAAALGDAALVTRGNLNNDIGVPLMLLELDETHEYAVFELGANHAGEIAYLASLVRPKIGIVTNAGPAHLEGFGSIEGVAHAKGELFAALGSGGIAIVNRDDDWYPLWVRLAEPARIRTFGRSADADCRAASLRSEGGAIEFDLVLDGRSHALRLPLPGSHNAVNACAAVLAATSAGLGADVVLRRLPAMRAASGRLNIRQAANGATLIDDTYNANPASMRAAANSAVALGRPVWMAIGDMGELGPDAERMHRELGEALREIGVVRLFATGPLSLNAVEGFGAGASHFADRDSLAAALAADAPPSVTILVKGSRSARMEDVVRRIADEQDGG